MGRTEMADATLTAMGERPGQRAVDRLAALFLLILLTAGSAALWIAIPLFCLWISGMLTDSFGYHFVIALPMTLSAMVLWAVFLAWLNRLYLRVIGVLALAEADEGEDWSRRLRGPLEPLLVAWFLIALGGLFVWFFLFAENPSQQVI